MSPTWRAAAATAVLALGALLFPPAIAAAGLALLAGAVAADALWARRTPTFHREVDEVLARGVPAPLKVEARAPGAQGVAIRQALPGDMQLEPREGGEQPTGGGEESGEAKKPAAGDELCLVATRRGRYRLPPLAARLTGPLRLATWDHEGGGEAEVHVYPDLPAARRVAMAARRSRFRDPSTHGRGALGLGTEFESIREYAPDDDIRQVNWLATARVGRPMSNDFRLEQDREVIVLIDAGRLMAAPVGDRSRLDAALDALAAVAVVADDVGDRFGAIAFDSDIRFEAAPRRGGGTLCVRKMFDLEPSARDSDYRRSFQRVERGKRALVLILTDLLDEAASASLIESVPILARRHSVAVGSVIDPDLREMTTTTPEGTDDAYRAAVAVEVLEARERVVARLRHAGADVIEADAGRLGAACVRSYLQAKALARL